MVDRASEASDGQADDGAFVLPDLPVLTIPPPITDAVPYTGPRTGGRPSHLRSLWDDDERHKFTLNTTAQGMTAAESAAEGLSGRAKQNPTYIINLLLKAVAEGAIDVADLDERFGG